MTTLADIQQPWLSGDTRIDALLSQFFHWQYQTPSDPAIYYTFSTTSGTQTDGFMVAGTLTPMSAGQEAAVRAALANAAQVTGIHFVEVADGNAADIHFAMTDIQLQGASGAMAGGVDCGFGPDTLITSYSADAYIYFDNAEYGSLYTDMSQGTAGYQILLHELGHALDLKHPHEGDVRLSAAEDNTGNTVMSYNWLGSAKGEYQSYDVNALQWWYGQDGLGGVSYGGVQPTVLNGGASPDRLVGGGGSDTLNGGDGDDTLLGGAGNDVMYGGPGRDVLDGGAGGDLYFASTGDTLVDSGGVDTVVTDVSWTLGSDFENLTLTGSAALTGTGNAGKNIMWGNFGDSTLIGGAGDDELNGGLGNSWLEGGTGHDRLLGFAGADRFVFREFGAANADLVGDFGTDADKIVLDRAAFTEIGAAGNFAAGDARFYAAAGASAGHDADDRIVYNSTSGELYYDADGSGPGAAQLIATVLVHTTFPNPAASDFVVIDAAAPGGAVINGTEGNDSLAGTAGNDTLNGFGGNDTLDGLAGADSMVGGAGDDLYFVDDAGDIVVEQQNAGTDEVRASVDYTLADWVNNLTLTGTAANGTGNAIDNVIVGNAGNNVLDGSDGADSLRGGAGNDTLQGGHRESAAWADTLDGGLGDDVYRVEFNDVIAADPGGVDSVIAWETNWTLGAGLDNLRLEGVADGEAGTGNELNNVIDASGLEHYGVLLGLGGNDTIMGGQRSLAAYIDGGTGNDTLIANNGGTTSADHFRFSATPGAANADLIQNFRTDLHKIELDGQVMPALGPSGPLDAARFYAAAGATGGHDIDDRVVYDSTSGRLYYDADGNGAGAAQLLFTVQSDAGVSASNIVVINGTPTPTPTPTPGQSISGTSGNDSLVGGSGNDTIYGNSGNDTIEGRGGNDLVSGGSGQDSYVWREFGAANADTVANFDTNWDAIRLDAAAFTNIGASGRFSGGDVRFYAAAGATAAHDADDRIVYNASSGQLFYDADGAGGAGAQLIATFQGAPTVAAGDINVFGTPSPTPTPTPTPGTINGTSGNDTLVGTAAPETLNGFAGDDSLVGGGGGDSYSGGDGNDTMNGWNASFGGTDANVDTMDGGLGNDRYYVDNAGDVLTDAGGVDTVVARNINWTLAAGFENLVMNNGQVESTRTGIGNELDNVLDGRSGGVQGTGGDGWYVHLEGLGGNDTLYGSVKDDLLVGGDGNDVLAGGQGFDTMTGGAGADRFAMDGIGESTITDFASGTDKLRLDGNRFANVGASGNFAAGDERFYAAAGANAAHDASDRLIYDTSSGNLFYDADGTGADLADFIGRLQGAPALAATDVEVVNGSTPTPTPGQSFSGTSGNDTIVGTSGNDTIYGNSGNDWLEGRGGNDLVSGGGGQDSYVFREFGAANADTLAQFDTNWDALRFDSAAFTGLGGPGHFASNDARFYAAAGASGAHDADDRIVYDTSTGHLYYDADGAGGADAQLVATVQGAPAVAANDVWVI